MEFKINEYFYVSETDLDRMAYLCINRGLTIPDAMDAVTLEWEAGSFYLFELIADQVFEEVARRIDALKN